MPNTLRIVHRTEYVYSGKVALNPHRLMVQARDAHDLRVDDAFLRIMPRARLRWFFDTFGNSAADATFQDETDRLAIESELPLRGYVADFRSRSGPEHVCKYPFTYTEEDARDLQPYLPLQNLQDGPIWNEWLQSNFTDRPGEAFRFLQNLNDAVHRATRWGHKPRQKPSGRASEPVAILHSCSWKHPAASDSAIRESSFQVLLGRKRRIAFF